jgi:hypothetical protein
MITLTLPAKLSCDEVDCQVSLPVTLCLLGNGGFGFQPHGDYHGWRFVHPRGVGGPLMASCSAHLEPANPGTPGQEVSHGR